jgi:hypothetical protein
MDILEDEKLALLAYVTCPFSRVKCLMKCLLFARENKRMTERLEEELAYDSRVLRSSKSARLDKAC